MWRRVVLGWVLLCGFSLPLRGEVTLAFSQGAPVSYQVKTRLDIEQGEGEGKQGVSLIQKAEISLTLIPGPADAPAFPFEVEIVLKAVSYSVEKKEESKEITALSGALESIDRALMAQLNVPFRVKVEEGLSIAKEYSLAYLLGLLPTSQPGEGELYDRLVQNLIVQVFALKGKGLKIDAKYPGRMGEVPFTYEIRDLRPPRVQAALLAKASKQEVDLSSAGEALKGVFGVSLLGSCSWGAENALLYQAKMEQTLQGELTAGSIRWPAFIHFSQEVLSESR